MARIEFLETPATSKLGVAGRSLPVPLQPSMAALARTARYFDAAAGDLNMVERTVAAIWNALALQGVPATVHQAAALVDGTGVPEEMRATLGSDFVVIVEPGDPGYTEDDGSEDDGSEDEQAEERPTGPVAEVTGEPTVKRPRKKS